MPIDKPPPLSQKVRFANFDIDLRSGDIRKNGRKVRLPDQPFRILLLLLERPGELVTREELRLKLWPADTFVDFDHGLNNAISRIREAFGDSAENPRFIETLPRRGYRFIAPVDVEAHGGAPVVAPVSPPAVDGEASLRLAPGLVARLPLQRWLAAIATGGVVIAIVVVLLALNLGGLRDRLAAIVGAKHAAPFTKIQSIAVLPLKNLSGDSAQEYFADGMTDALITELGKIHALRVISLQSVLRYKQTNKPLPEIAHELKVDALVEGSVVRSGELLRVNVQFVQAEPERHLWSDSFVRNTSDVLRLQSEIAAAVTQAAQVAVTPEQRSLLLRSEPVNPGAYQAWLRGRQMYSRFDDEWFDEAVEYLEQAIRLDPTYAPPYATLAEVYCTDMRYSYDDLHQRATWAAGKALELDDTLADAHAAQAYVNLRFRWNWTGAEQEIKRAIELNPNSAEALEMYGYYLTLMGRFDEAIASYRRAIDLDPLNFLPNERLGWAYTIAHRDDEAIAQLRELARREPAMFMTSYSLTRVYAFNKMYREAMEAVRKSERKIDARAQPAKFDYGWVIAASGNRREAEQLTQEMINYSKRHYLDPSFIAFTYAGLGENNKAIEWLERGYQQRARFMIYLKVIRDVDNLRSDARFQDLLLRMNFPR
jgi:TolB-like protein/DNA-binding winged helix-turn-helix (wHTH) protein/Tfp pilus assembly protein PilF